MLGAAALAVVVAVVLQWAAPGPAEIFTALRSPQQWVGRHGADRAVVTVSATVGWLLLGWLVAGLAVTVLSALPGTTGRLARLLAQVVLPRAARQALAVALGVGLVTGGGAGVAGADPPPAPAGTSAPSTSAPGTSAPSTSAPGATVDWPVRPPAGQPPPIVTPSPGVDAPVDGAVLVRSGDTLWAIAADRLGPRADTGEVAAAVDGWYAENRAVIGADPDLIIPGQRLLPPGLGS